MRHKSKNKLFDNTPPRITGDGHYENQIAGFDGNVIEITE